jgi:hypothetical protein
MVWPRAELGTRRIRTVSVRTQFVRMACAAGGIQACLGEARVLIRESTVAAERGAQGDAIERGAARGNNRATTHSRLHSNNALYRRNENQNDHARSSLAVDGHGRTI